MADERVRVEIAFDGGQIMGAVLLPDGAAALERALAERTEKAVAIDAEDGRYTIRIDRVVYLKRFARESRVGFGV